MADHSWSQNNGASHAAPAMMTMMMQQPFRVSPGSSLGPFTLGDSLNHSVACIRGFRHPQGPTGKPALSGLGPNVGAATPSSNLLLRTKVCFNSARPYGPPVAFITLKLVAWNMNLVFTADSQRLVRIEMNNLAALPLTFSNSTVVFGVGNVPNLLKLYNLLGPTYPGKREGDMYNLQYPGLWLSFAAKDDKQEIPLEMADKTSPLATRLVLHPGPDVEVIPALAG